MGKILRWKKLFVCVSLMVAVAIGMGSWMVTPAQAANISLNLKAVWNPNPEPDMGGYRIYKSTPNNSTPWYYWPGTGDPEFNQVVTSSIDDTIEGMLLPLSPTQLLFVCFVPTVPDVGFVDFALKSFDTNGNKSAKATARYNYNVDVTPPGAPTGLTISKQP